VTTFHERDTDREREAQIAATLAAAWKCKLVAAPPRSRFDYTAERDGQPTGVVEIKCRLNRGPDDYGGWVLLNEDKREALLEATEGPAIHVWCFPPVAYWIDARSLPSSARLITAGRPDWRDTRDARPAWRINIADTRRVLLSFPDREETWS
jgi:hypothetical protein